MNASHTREEYQHRVGMKVELQQTLLYDLLSRYTTGWMTVEVLRDLKLTTDSDGDSNNSNYIYESVFVFWKVNDGNPSSVYCSERYNFYFLSFTLLVWPLL